MKQGKSLKNLTEQTGKTVEFHRESNRNPFATRKISNAFNSTAIPRKPLKTPLQKQAKSYSHL